MTTWAAFHDAEPDVAARAQVIFSSTTNAVLGTLRKDGSPRLSGIDPFWFEGELWIGSMPGARKGADLRRDPRCSLHAIPWESRKVREGAADPGDADAKVAGRAVLADDADLCRRVNTHITGEMEFEPPGPSDLFRIDVGNVVVISVDGEDLVVDRWSADDGRTTVRRT